ncbi:MAG: CPBP family intramembrane glutamic endopeptidase, partial [Planctomycetota bacterium]
MEEQFPPPRNLVLIAVVFEGGLGVVALALGWLLGYPPLEAVCWTVPAAIWGTAAGLPMLVLLLATARVPVWPFSDLLRVVDELLVPLFRGCRVVDLAVISALAGWGEELLFRGVIQEAVAGWAGGPWGVWVGLAVASVLFGLAHAITVSYFLLAALMGLYLGGLWIASDNLLVPIMAHAVYDFLALVY